MVCLYVQLVSGFGAESDRYRRETWWQLIFGWILVEIAGGDQGKVQVSTSNPGACSA
jgi:hypothetical protein